MSASQNWVDDRSVEIQAAIDARALDDEYEFKELFAPVDWENLGNLRRTVTKYFWKRIVGSRTSDNPVFENIQVSGVRPNGRERMFVRIKSNSNPENEPLDNGAA